MPIMEYFCKKCNKKFEVYLRSRMNENDKQHQCPICKKMADKLLPTKTQFVMGTDSFKPLDMDKVTEALNDKL